MERCDEINQDPLCYLVGLANEKLMVGYLWRKAHRYFLSPWLSKSDNFFQKSTGQIDLARGVLFTFATNFQVLRTGQGLCG